MSLSGTFFPVFQAHCWSQQRLFVIIQKRFPETDGNILSCQLLVTSTISLQPSCNYFYHVSDKKSLPSLEHAQWSMFNLPLPHVLSTSTVTFSELPPYGFFSLQTAGELPKGDVLMADPLFFLPLGNPSTFSAIFSSSLSVFFPLKDKSAQGCKTHFYIGSSDFIVIWTIYNSRGICFPCSWSKDDINKGNTINASSSCGPHWFHSVSEHPRKVHGNSCRCTYDLFNSCIAATSSFQAGIVLASSWKSSCYKFVLVAFR